MDPTGKALSNATDGVVVLVDYGMISYCNYSRTVSEIVPSVGYYLAQLITSFALDLSRVDIIGVGLGAHMAGYAGAALGGNINRITGN